MTNHELVDLVNDNGEVLRTAVPRPDAERLTGENLHIPTIGCVVLNSLGEVLVHNRSDGKIFEGCLDNVYEAVTSGEKPEDAAEYECAEEVGVRIERIQKVGIGVNINHYYQSSFVVIAKDDLDKTNREVSWAEFFPIRTLRSDNRTGKHKFTSNFFIGLDAALESLKAS